MIVEGFIHQTADWKKPVKDVCSIVDVVAIAYFRNRQDRKKFSDKWTRPIKAVVHLVMGISALLKAKRWQDSAVALWDTGWAVWSLADWGGHPIKYSVKGSDNKEKDALIMLHIAKRLTGKWNKIQPALYMETWPGRIIGISAVASILGKALEFDSLKEASKVLSTLEIVVRRWHTPTLLMLGR